jgi:hypothetical protein
VVVVLAWIRTASPALGALTCGFFITVRRGTQGCNTVGIT